MGAASSSAPAIKHMHTGSCCPHTKTHTMNKDRLKGPIERRKVHRE
jgi:hypothetical protein